MRVYFCNFTDSSGRAVAVNPQRVSCICVYKDDITRIELDKDHNLFVKGSIAEVERQLTIDRSPADDPPRPAKAPVKDR